jgi:glycosyltransferase involved in cell wall biosynthesis
VIPNGVDTAKYHPVTPDGKHALRMEQGIPDDAVVLIYLGYLGPVKGTDIVFKVWCELHKAYPRLILLLVGDYPRGKALGLPLAEWLRTKGLDPSILKSPQLKLVGPVEDAEKYLQTADVFIFPSRQEGFGTVQIEAMACGLSCVVNDLPGVSADIFPDENVGYRIRNNNMEDYIRVLSDLIAHPEKRECIGRTTRQRAVECFSRHIVAGKYVEYFNQLVGSAPV